MNKALALALLGIVALSACGNRPDPAPASADGKLNGASTVTGPAARSSAGQADAEDPKTGTNSERPDSPRDLKPGTDGNTNPPTR